MNPLDDPLMAALCVICRADDFDVRDDYDLSFRVPTDDDPRGYVVARVPGADFDALVARGFVDLIGDDEFEVSERGKYWYERAEKRREKAAKPSHARRAISWRRARRS